MRRMRALCSVVRRHPCDRPGHPLCLAGLQVRMTMPEFVRYMRAGMAEEVPLYIFDRSFSKEGKCPQLLRHYDPATLKVFRDSFFEPLGRMFRPAFRWLVVGPARSGAPWHIDPHSTSAWNTLLHGRKRWALYPPSHPPPGVAVDEDAGGRVKDFSCGYSSLAWFMQVYPTLTVEEVRAARARCFVPLLASCAYCRWHAASPTPLPHARLCVLQKPIEFVQRPGDTVFIPAGWWHMVLNLDETVR